MLKFMYYAMGVAFMLHEISWLINPIDKAKDSIDFLAKTKKYKGLKWDEYSNEYKEALKLKLFAFSHIAFILLGLFTFQWWAFLVFMVMQFTVVAFLSKMLKSNVYAYASLHWVNSLIGLLFTLFVIINSYHLKIQLNDALAAFGLNQL